MRQRSTDHHALSCNAAFVIGDKPTTAPAATTQGQVPELIAELQQLSGKAMVLITHNLSVLAPMAEDVIAMQRPPAAVLPRRARVDKWQDTGLDSVASNSPLLLPNQDVLQ